MTLVVTLRHSTCLMRVGMMARKRELVTYTHDGETRLRAKRTHTIGYVRTLKSGKTRVEYRVDGKRYYSHAFDNKTDAERYRVEIAAQVLAGTWKSPATIEAEKFGKYSHIWVEQRVTRRNTPLRPKTKAEYLRQLDEGLKQFAVMPLNEITPALVRSWHASRTKNAGATAAGAEARLLHAIMTTAESDEIIKRNPVPSELLKTRTGKAHRAPTSQELAAIIAQLPEKWQLAAYFAAFGGLRIGEWSALTRNDVKTVGKHVQISISKQVQRVGGKWITGKPKSDEGIRVVALPAWLTPIVEEHLKMYVGRFPKSTIFEPDIATGGHMSVSSWSHMWHRACIAVGITDTIRPHDLRHFYGSALADSGLGIRQLQSALGHGTAQASLVYLDEARGTSAEIADTLQPLPQLPVESKVVPIRAVADE